MERVSPGRNGYAALLIETRQPEMAIGQSQKGLAHDPANDTAQMNIGYAYLKMGEFNEAEKAYRTAATNNPKIARALTTTWLSHSRCKIDWNPHRELQEAIRLDPPLLKRTTRGNYILAVG